jgi:hypothetical protein
MKDPSTAIFGDRRGTTRTDERSAIADAIERLSTHMVSASR